MICTSTVRFYRPRPQLENPHHVDTFSSRCRQSMCWYRHRSGAHLVASKLSEPDFEPPTIGQSLT
jgi:hypothetical protein